MREAAFFLYFKKQLKLIYDLTLTMKNNMASDS